MTTNLSNLIERGLCLCFTNDFLSCCLKTRIYPLGDPKRCNLGISHMCFSGVKQDVISCWNPSINVKYTLFSLLAHKFSHVLLYLMHGLILINYTEYRTLFLFEDLDPTSNRLIYFSRENWWRSMNIDLCVHSR